MKFTLFLPLLFISYLSVAQRDTLIISGNYIKLPKDTNLYRNAHIILYDSVKHEKKQEGDFLNRMKNGLWISYFNGVDTLETNYKNGKKEGDYITKYTTGVIKRNEIYHNGEFVSGKCYNEKGEEIPFFKGPVIFDYVEQMPTATFNLPEYLSNNLHYPRSARRAGIEGRVIIKFVVNEDGSVSNVTITKGIGEACDEEAKRVVMEMPAWKPGTQNGKPVKVYFNLPIVFKLTD